MSPQLIGMPAHSPALQSRVDGFHPSGHPEQGWEQPKPHRRGNSDKSVLGVKEHDVGVLTNWVRFMMGC